MPLLPLEKLVYGSDDMGKTVKAEPDMQGLVQHVASTLHLAQHPVADGKGITHNLYTAGDVEGHLGKVTLCFLWDY